jgi:hypothetical protein
MVCHIDPQVQVTNTDLTALQLLGPLIGRFKPVIMTIALHVAM